MEQDFGPCNGPHGKKAGYTASFPKLHFSDGIKKAVFPPQKDEYNCGVLICMYMLDLCSSCNKISILKKSTQLKKDNSTLIDLTGMRLGDRWLQPLPNIDGMATSDNTGTKPGPKTRMRAKKSGDWKAENEEIDHAQ